MMERSQRLALIDELNTLDGPELLDILESLDIFKEPSSDKKADSRMQSKKYKISELVQYYIDKYGIKINEDNPINDIRALSTQITRTLQSVHVGEKTLWESLKPNGSGARKISVEEFEKYCSSSWCMYIKDHFQYDKNKFNLEFARVQVQNRWIDEAQKAMERNNDYYVQGFCEEDNEYFSNTEPSDNTVLVDTLSEKIKQEEVYIMIKAIYDIFYTSLNQQLLEKDLIIQNEKEKFTPFEYNAEIRPEWLKSDHHLENPLDYYVGEKRK